MRRAEARQAARVFLFRESGASVEVQEVCKRCLPAIDRSMRYQQFFCYSMRSRAMLR